ncbi:aldo/keto reductase [Actinoplanes sp. NPDC049596]|uniref:aldo/keto reductase n=1 Tax=unclassified Actinoplanes TaxID=2626549 RepID=UPI003419548D
METTLSSYRTLGRSGLRVSPFALGAMNFGEEGGFGCSAAESSKIIDAYLAQGGNFIDTANFYTNGHSEVILGDYLAGQPGLRDRLVLATKFFGNMHPGDPNGGGAGRKAIVAQLEQSLRRLQTSYVDLYWLHNFDAFTPVEETLRALDDLVAAGKVRYVGFSNTPGWFTAQAHTMALLRGWPPVIALQVEYSLLARTVEGELAPFALQAGMGLTPWSPLAGGFLSGKYARDAAPTGRGVITGGPSAAQFAVIDVLTEVAASVGAPVASVALAWLRQKPGVTAPILGPGRVEHLTANLEALTLTLDAGQMARLDEASAPVLNYPYELNRATGRMLQFAGATVDGVESGVYPPLLQSSRF